MSIVCGMRAVRVTPWSLGEKRKRVVPSCSAVDTALAPSATGTSNTAAVQGHVPRLSIVHTIHCAGLGHAQGHTQEAEPTSCSLLIEAWSGDPIEEAGIPGQHHHLA